VRILIYSINFYPELTSTGKYTGEMANWLAKHNHEVRIITAPPYYPQWRVYDGYSAIKYQKDIWQFNAQQIEIFRTPLWVPSKPNGWKRLLHLASFAVGSFPTVISQIRWRPELVVVVAPTLAIAPAALLLARLSGAKIWLHVQDFEVDAAFGMAMLRSGLIRRLALAIEGFLMKRFHRVSTISRRMLDRLSAKGIADAQRVFFPNWVDSDKIYPLDRPSTYRADLNLTGDVVVALYAGNLGEKQGLELLIESAKLTAGNSQILWVIAGEGSTRLHLEALARGLANIRWLPLQPQERLNELLNLADIHLLPQRADAADLVMPSKLTGMLASGRPVVATAAAGTQVAELVAECGIVVPPGDVSAMAQAVVLLAEDTKQRCEQGKKARRYAEAHLNQDAIMSQFESDATELVSST